MTNKRPLFRWLLLALLVGLLALTLWQAVRPVPTPEPTRVLGILSGTTTPHAAYLESEAYGTHVPPTRSANDPLATPGAGRRQPYGIVVGSYLSGIWSTAPTGCDASTCATSNINWAAIDTVVDAQRAITVTYRDGTTEPSPVWLYLPPNYIEPEPDSFCGTSGDPCTELYLPGWMQNSTYMRTFRNTEGYRTINVPPTPVYQEYSNKYYYAISYSSTWLARMKQLLTEAAAHFDGRIEGVVVNVGFARESQPNKLWSHDIGTQAQLIKSHEIAVASCTAYKTYVRELTEHAYSVFAPLGIEVQLAPGPNPCSFSNSSAFRDALLNDATYGWETRGLDIGFSMNANDPDRNDADALPTWYNADYRWYAVSRTLDGQDRPVSHESFLSPSSTLSDGDTDPWRYLYWSHLVTSQMGQDHTRDNSNWMPFQSDMTWEVVNYSLGKWPWRLSYIFRDAEYPTYSWATGYGTSGLQGGFGNWLTLEDDQDYDQACATWLKPLAESRNAIAVGSASNVVSGQACRSVASQGMYAIATYVPLPTPAVTPRPTATPDDIVDLRNRLLNRQALVLDATGARSVMTLTLAGDHPQYGAVHNVRLQVEFLDVGTDDFEIVLPTASGVYTQTVAKGGTGLWQREAFDLTAIALQNTLPGGGFARLVNDGTQPEYLHAVYVDVGTQVGADPTATPSATPTVTPTRTATPTATETPTSTPTSTSTPLYTPTATPTYAPGTEPGPRFSEAHLLPTLDWNLSGRVDGGDAWLELYNTSATAVDLGGWRLEFFGSAEWTYIFPAGTLIPGNGYKVLYAADIGAMPWTGASLVTTYLWNPQSNLVFVNDQNWATAGLSCALPNPAAVVGQFVECIDGYTPSPGRSN